MLSKEDIKSISDLVSGHIESNNEKIFGKVDQMFESNNEKIFGKVGQMFESNNESIKDMIEFAVDKSEKKVTARIDNLTNELHEFKDEVGREISDLAEMNRAFLSKLDNHESRIEKLETKLAVN